MKKVYEKGRWFFAIRLDIWAFLPSIGIVYRRYDKYRFFLSFLILCFQINIHFSERRPNKND